jgi:beta-mannosidase
VIDKDLHYFVKPKDLKLTDPQITTKIVDKEDHFEIVVSASALAKNVFLYADGLEEQFSDNFFDVLPGESITVEIPRNERTTQALKELKVLHLYQTVN